MATIDCYLGLDYIQYDIYIELQIKLKVKQ